MKTNPTQPVHRGGYALSLWQAILATLVLVAGSAYIAFAAAPPAGVPIGNQATATYDDGSGITRTVTSNLVQTIVQQVASLSLTADRAKTAAPGNQVTYPHTLTNTGNGTDTFTLALTNNPTAAPNDNFDLSSLAIYADANQDGVPDNTTNLNNQTVTLTSAGTAGATFNFVVVGTVPGVGVAAGDKSQITVLATSGFNNTVTATNTDTTTVTGNAVISVTKAISQNTGAPGSGPYTYTLTYTNTGNATATNLILTDLLPTGLTYTPGSARWSVTGSTSLTDTDNTDAQGTAPNTIIYDFGVTTGNTVTAKINQVAPGSTRTLTFQVTINTPLAPGPIDNTASFTYNDGTGTTATGSTNPVRFTITATTAVSISDTGSTTDQDGLTNDIVTSNTAVQGSTVLFANVLKNTGTGTDTFNITTTNISFPAGTTFQILKSDGASPLLDTNNDGIPDTGPLAANATYTVVVKVILPPGASGGPFDVTATAASVTNAAGAGTDSVTDRLLRVSAVDLTNNAALPGGLGAGVGPEATRVVTNTTIPGSTTTFILFVNNTSAATDTYALTVSTDATFATTTLPAGWSVQFFLDNGDGVRNAGDTLITTDTGNVLANSSVRIFAEVTVPANATIGTQDIYFRAQSTTTSTILDRLHDAVTVAVQAPRLLTLQPNNTGQVFPGGTVVYQHTLSNTGSETEGGTGPNTSTISLNLTDNQAGFTSVVYYDANNNGVIDAADSAIDDSVTAGGTALPGTITLAPGASIRLLVKVTAPAGALLGTTDIATLTVSVTGVINSKPAPANIIVTDTSTVVSGDLTLIKKQAIDTNCNGPDTTYATAILNNVAPGQCVCYEITAHNAGTADAKNVVINDSTPISTTLKSITTISPKVTLGAIAQAPTDGTTGAVATSAVTLPPGQDLVLTFCVRLDN